MTVNFFRISCRLQSSSLFPTGIGSTLTRCAGLVPGHVLKSRDPFLDGRMCGKKLCHCAAEKRTDNKHRFRGRGGIHRHRFDPPPQFVEGAGQPQWLSADFRPDASAMYSLEREIAIWMTIAAMGPRAHEQHTHDRSSPFLVPATPKQESKCAK